MSVLVHLRQKIRSVQTTKKITHAVRLVSMSLYNKLDKIDKPLKFYTKNVKNMFVEILAQSPAWQNQILFPRDVFNTNPLFIVIATSKGLCGSLNSNLFRYLDSALFIEEKQTPIFITIGQKATLHIKKKYPDQILTSYSELSSNNFITIANDLVEKIVNAQKNYSTVTLFASEAKSFFSHSPHKFTLIPMSMDPISEAASAFHSEPIESDDNSFIWEQPHEEILDFLSVRYLRSSIIHILFQALRAEHAARFLAMENSTNNATKYLERLTMQLNKQRQALITKEVSELSSGFTTTRGQ